MFEDLIEEEPVAVIESLPPRQTAECIGHEDVEKTLLEMSVSGHLPHALIFAGPEGIGKATMAFRLARYLLLKGVGADENNDSLFGDDLPSSSPESLHMDQDQSVFAQVASGGHPDMITIERQFDEKKNRLREIVEINQIRRIAPFLHMTAAKAGGWRVVIVDDADRMNKNAQNAILKILEEPPANVLLILITHRTGALISTVRSRCRIINFQPLEKDKLAFLLRKQNPAITQEEIDILYDISGGSIGQSLRIIDEGGLATVDKAVALLQSWPDWNWPETHILANKLAGKGQEDSYRAFTDVMRWVVGSLTRAKARGEAPCNILMQGRLADMWKHYTLEEWNKICEKLNVHFDTVVRSSLDKRHGVMGAFSVFD